MPLDARNGTILRRMLGAVSWLYAVFDAILILMILPVQGGGTGLYHPKAFAAILAGHAVLMGLAGRALRGGSTRAVQATLVAAAGSVFIMVLELLRSAWMAAGIDAVYVLLAAVILWLTRNLP